MQEPFNYKAELRKVRETLDEKLAAYLSENPGIGYREVAKQFHLSAAAVCAIAKKYSRNRRRGRIPPPVGKSRFFIRYVANGKEFEMNLTVIAPKDIPTARIRSAIKEYFDCRELKRGSSARTQRHADYALTELTRSKGTRGGGGDT